MKRQSEYTGTLRIAYPVLLLLLGACSGGGGNDVGIPPPLAETPIFEIQGNGAASPLEGEVVAIRGFVTADFQDGDADQTGNLGGFFVQGVPDANLESSEGIFVFDGDNPAVDIAVGDSVRVTGTVREHFGETRIAASAVEVVGTGGGIPAPIFRLALRSVLNSDGATIPDLERYEGMHVRIPDTLVVSNLVELENYGTVMLSEDGSPYQFTNLSAPDVAGYAAHEVSAGAARIMLDDGQREAGVTPPRYLGVRRGDEVTDIKGVIRYSRGSGGGGFEGYRLVPTEDPPFTSANPRPAAPVVGGSLRIASFNVLMLFSSIDTGPDICGPAGSSDCLGADSAEEQQRQVQKLVTALRMIDADIAGLVELENNATASLQLIVDALNSELGAGTYAYIDTGTVGSGVIKNGIIYKPAAVTPVGALAILDSGIDARFDDLRNRPAVARSFEVNASGARLTVAVNHLKSKGSSCASVGDPDTGDGQANCAQTRTAAAAALADWLATDPTASGDADALIIGDLNAHTFEDPLAALTAASYVSVTEALLGPESYTFVFDGKLGTLDHAVASASLAPQIVDALEWHINADESAVVDYNLDGGRDPALFDGTSPYRASDHDPLIIGIDLTP